MAITHILVPLGGETDDDRAALRAGFALAAPFGAHVTALFGGGDARAARTALEDEAARAGAALRDEACKAGAPTASGRSAEGTLADAAEAEARFADIVVFALLGGDAARRAAFIRVLMNSARPVLLASRGGALRLEGRMAVGWDGELAAARALTAAVPLLKRATAVDLIGVGAIAPGRIGAGAAADYLALHGVTATPRTVAPAASAGKTLSAAAQADGAALLVMGAYGHSRLVETILGGTTAHLLEEAALPVLLMH